MTLTLATCAAIPAAFPRFANAIIILSLEEYNLSYTRGPVVDGVWDA